MWPMRRILKYVSVGSVCAGTAASLHSNQYNVDSIGGIRLGRAAATVLKIMYVYKTELYSSSLPQDSQEFLLLKSRIHKKAAESLLDLCCANRGVFVKVGQHIGALEYILPQEYVETMKVLHSQAPTSSYNEVLQVLQEDLQCDPKEIFEEFSQTPVGAASLAQVHRAKLKDGTPVAVKIQHPYIKGNSSVDMKTMEGLVKLAEWIFPDFRFQWLVTEMKRNIPMELNFLQEAENAEKASKMFKHFPWLKDLTNQFRWEYSKLWLSILKSDMEGMKNHSHNLGVGEMWPLFACMVSGRTWKTIMSGVDKVTFSDSEKNEFQKEIPNFLPQITGVLQDVDRQMLLIFRTNDLMRGIEHTLKTHARMSSFLVMSRWCVRSVYNEQLKDCHSRFEKWCLLISQQWTLMKISFYYAYLSVSSLSLSCMLQVMTS